ncbi:MAG TPA: beta-propeller fold lactonase family protein [Acidisarcina sp.]|nr:beta-propeller fold lactonase family protein [Acidisarcina sp.]
MKFRNIGQVLLASVVSVGLCLGVTSCSTSFTVGFLYVVGASTSNGASGQISGFKIDNDNGRLTPITKSPFSTAGANPIRAVMFPGGRFLYVLNSKPTGTAGGNIALFTVGGNGLLTFQESYSSQGANPVSIAAGSNGADFIYVLDQEVHDANGNVINSGNGAITVFSVDPNTGRLSLVTNQQVLTSGGSQLTYFPVGNKPTAFGPIANSTIVGSYIYTVDADQSVFPYAINASNGQLTVTPNGPQPTGATHISAIGGNSSNVFLLDAGNGGHSTILPYTRGPNGSLQTVVGGAIPNDPTVTNPSDLVVDSKGKFLYIANAGPNNNPANPASAISAYSILPNATSGLLTAVGGEPFPSGSQPVCILEDPSNQYIYTANHSDSTVTGRKIDTNTGVLNDLVKGSSIATTGSPTWCVVTGRTQ